MKPTPVSVTFAEEVKWTEAIDRGTKLCAEVYSFGIHDYNAVMKQLDELVTLHAELGIKYWPDDGGVAFGGTRDLLVVRAFDQALAATIKSLVSRVKRCVEMKAGA